MIVIATPLDSPRACRELRTTTEDDVADGRDLLETIAAEESDWERAGSAAVDAIATAYDDYADRLEAMELDPRPVC